MVEVMLVEVILIAIIEVVFALVGVFWIARVLASLSLMMIQSLYGPAWFLVVNHKLS